MKNIFALTITVLMSTAASGQMTILAWEMTGQTDYGTDGLTASAVATGITNTLELTRGSGVTSSGTAAANAWGGTGWNYATAADALAANVYVTFGLTVSTSYSTSLTAITLNYRRSTTGPTNARWDYQVNAGTWTTIGEFVSQFPSTSTDGKSITPVDLSGLADLQDVPAGTIVNFRIIPYGASDPSTGKWYVYGPVAGYDLAVTGSLAEVPLAVTINNVFAITEAGSVCLKFATASEVSLAGFDILRAGFRDGPFRIVSSYKSNASLRASGSETSGGSYTFVDSKVVSGQTYFYKIQAVTKSGAAEQIGEILAVQVTTPQNFALYQNFPNPFNPSTVINYQLPTISSVTLKVYDVLGREIATLVNGRQSAGFYRVTFEGARHASGMYIYRLDARGDDGGTFTSVKSLMLVR